jgi:uncharacterized protein (DUF1778 family)
MAESAVKTERLNLRTTSDQNALIRRAAALKGQNVTDFVLSSVVETARTTIETFERMTLSVRDGEAFVDALINPPAPAPAARDAAKNYKRQYRT